MPNEVYAMTHGALSALVSSRAATHVLTGALESVGLDQDHVTVREMRRLLAGKVRRELRTTFPMPGLAATLKGIADDLHRLNPSADVQVAADRARAAGASAPKPAAGGRRGRKASAATSLADASRADAAPADATLATDTVRDLLVDPVSPAEGSGPTTGAAPDAAGAAQALAAGDTGTANVTPQPAEPTASARAQAHQAPYPQQPLTDSVTAAAVRHFGELEAVLQIVVVKDGKVAVKRGEGIEVERLPNLVRSTRALLASEGNLQLYTVERAEGTLFVFPFSNGSVVVVTTPHVNLGAILAARAALEESA